MSLPARCKTCHPLPDPPEIAANVWKWRGKCAQLFVQHNALCVVGEQHSIIVYFEDIEWIGLPLGWELVVAYSQRDTLQFTCMSNYSRLMHVVRTMYVFGLSVPLVRHEKFLLMEAIDWARDGQLIQLCVEVNSSCNEKYAHVLESNTRTHPIHVGSGRIEKGAALIAIWGSTKHHTRVWVVISDSAHPTWADPHWTGVAEFCLTSQAKQSFHQRIRIISTELGDYLPNVCTQIVNTYVGIYESTEVHRRRLILWNPVHSDYTAPFPDIHVTLSAVI